MMCAQEDFELGEERARVLRLAHELRTLRGISHDQVLSAVMATKLYRQIGEPALQELNLSQAKAITRLLERWLEQAKTQTPRPRRVASTAPPAPWSKGTDHQTEEGNDQWI